MSEIFESHFDNENNISRNDKLVSININDIFDELTEENHKLRKQLFLSNKYNTILEKFKIFLDQNLEKCECFESNKFELDLIYSEFNEFIDNEKHLDFDKNFTLNNNFIINDINISNNNNNNNNNNNKRNNRLIIKSLVNKAKKSLNAKKSSLSEWKRNKRVEVQRHKCHWNGCNFKTHRPKILSDHLNVHKEVRPYVCSDSKCGKTFFSHKCLKAHEKRHIEGKGYKMSTASEELVQFKSCYQKSMTFSPNKVQKEVKNKTKVRPEVKNRLKIETIEANITQIEDNIYDNNNNDNNSTQNTENHSIYKLKKYRYYCSWVGCDFRTQKNLVFRDHMNIHKDIRPYVCPQSTCDKRFFSAKSLSAHRKRHSDSGIYKCSYTGCGFNGRTLDIVMAHIKQCHSVDQPYDCCDCELRFETEFAFRRHLASHLSTNYKCDYPECEFKSNQLSKYRIHLRRHTGEKPFKCDFPKCGKTFSALSGLKDHQIRHSDLRPYHCSWPGCESKFKRANDLRTHSNYHTNERLLKCDWPGCEFKTLTYKVLKEHEMKHNGESYECTWNKCQRKFKLKRDLENHLALHENPLKCDWPGCEKSYTMKSSFKWHMTAHRKQINK